MISARSLVLLQLLLLTCAVFLSEAQQQSAPRDCRIVNRYARRNPSANCCNRRSGVECSNGRVTVLRAINSNSINSLNGLNALTELTAVNGSITAIPQWVMQLRGVRTLNFANNKLSGELPAFISQMRSLRTLDLSGNQYSGRLERLCALRNLEVLSLKGNNFEGALPACFRSLTRLRILDLTANKLSGDLSNSVSNMRNLGVLLVAGNQFTGKFPALSTLRSVDVTGVKFTSIADIPKPRNMNLCVVGSTELCTDKLTPGSLAEFCNVKTVCGGQQSPAPSATDSSSDIAQATPSQATAQPPAEEPVAATPSPTNPEPAPAAESTTPPAASADQSQPAKSTFLTNTSEVPIIIATAVIVVAGFLILTYLNRRADKSNTDVPATTTTKNIPSLGTSKNNNNRQSHGSLPVSSFRETMMSIPGAEPYSFSMSDKEGFKASVRKPYLKSQEDEVTLNVNDEVTVESTFEDGWCLGMNITTGESGYFPLICLK